MESPKIDYIQSKDNKTIKHIISLQQRKYRQKFGEYTVEGIRAVTDIGKKDFLRSILIRESKRSELEPLVQKGFTVSSVYRRLSIKKRPCSLMGGTVSLSVSCFI